MTTAGPARDLRPLFDPTSVAVVGASDDERKWGNWLSKGALRGESRRRVVLVNRRGGTILGRRVYTSLSEVPDGVELAVLSVPADQFEAAVEDALSAGARAIVGISAGLGESGADGRGVEEAAVRRVRAAGAVLLGPNCLGILDASTELYVTSNAFPPGPVGLISQSGNLALELGVKAELAGLGFVRFASLGNQADLDVADLVVSFASAPDVEAIAIYCEDFRDGRRFLEAARMATGAGKPVVLLSVGASRAAARAARSHTGALVSGSLPIEAACRAAGVEQVSTPQQLVDLLAGLLLGVSPAGPRVAVLADGGGHGAVASDVAEAAGLVVPALSSDLETRLMVATGTRGSTSNPVDLAGAGEQDVWSFHRVLAALLESGEVDSVLLTGYFGGYGLYGEALASAEAEVAGELVETVRASGRVLAVHAMHTTAPGVGGPPPPIARLRAGRIPVYSTVEAAAFVLARLVRRASGAPEPLPELLEAEAGPPEGGYWAARHVLEEAGVVFAPSLRVTDADEARAAAYELGYPVVLKAASIEHKSDAGGVVLGIDDDISLERAVSDLQDRLGPQELAVESMLESSGGVELLLGARRDPRFGPITLVGLGGVYTEVLADVAAALAPVTGEQAVRLIRSLRGAPLLLGSRGRPPLDIDAAAAAVVALSRVAASRPAISEIEVNPLLVRQRGAYGLDARLVLDPALSGAEPDGSPIASRGGGGTPWPQASTPPSTTIVVPVT
jgi:acetate---CoA ligase (ADP-forming)